MRSLALLTACAAAAATAGAVQPVFAACEVGYWGAGWAPYGWVTAEPVLAPSDLATFGAWVRVPGDTPYNTSGVSGFDFCAFGAGCQQACCSRAGCAAWRYRVEGNGEGESRCGCGCATCDVFVTPTSATAAWAGVKTRAAIATTGYGLLQGNVFASAGEKAGCCAAADPFAPPTRSGTASPVPSPLPAGMIASVAEGAAQTPATLGWLRADGVKVLPGGDILLADAYQHQVLLWSVAQARALVFAGDGVGRDAGGNGVLAVAASLIAPQAVTYDPAGDRAIIADAGSHKVRAVSMASLRITTLAGTGAAASTGDGGPATSAGVHAPCGLAMHPSGHLYVAEGGSHVVRRVTVGTGIITRVAGVANAEGSSGRGGPATSARLSLPSHLALYFGANAALNGVLFVAEQGSATISALWPNGTLTAYVGRGGRGFSPDGTPARAAAITRPTGVAVDGGGTLFFAEGGTVGESGGSNCVRRVLAGRLATVAGVCNSSAPRPYTNAVPATSAALDFPGGMSFSLPSGLLYFADMGHGRVRAVRPVPPSPGPSATRSRSPSHSRSRSRSRSRAPASRSATASRSRKPKAALLRRRA